MNITELFELREPNLRKTARSSRIMQSLRAQYPASQSDSEALLYHFRDGQRRDRDDIMRLDYELDSDEAEIDRIQKDLDRLRKKTNLSESRRQELIETHVLRDPVYHKFHVLGRTITEAAMTEPQILALFGNVEQNLNQAGSNRTMIGRGKDVTTKVAKSVKDALTGIWRGVQSSAPVSAVDTAYDQATDAVARLGGGENSAPMMAIRRYREMVKMYPKLSGFAKAAFVAIAGLATGGAGLPAIAGLTYAIDSGIRGDKLSTIILKGTGAALLAYLAQSLFSGSDEALPKPPEPSPGPIPGPVPGPTPGPVPGPQDVFPPENMGPFGAPDLRAQIPTPTAPDTGIRFPPGTFPGGDTGYIPPGQVQAPTVTAPAPVAGVNLDVPGPAPQMPAGLDGYVRDASGELVRSSDGMPVRTGFAGVSPQEYVQATQGLSAEQLQALGGADPTDPFIRSRLGLPPLREGVFIVREWDSRFTLDHGRNRTLTESARSQRTYLTGRGVMHVFEEIERCQDHAIRRGLRLLEYVRQAQTTAPATATTTRTAGAARPGARTVAPAAAAPVGRMTARPSAQRSATPGTVAQSMQATQPAAAVTPAAPATTAVSQPDLLRPDMPLVAEPADPTADKKPGLFGRIGSALQTFGQQLTRKITKEKLKMNWHQIGKPTDSNAVATFLASQNVPWDVISGVYQSLGLPAPTMPNPGLATNAGAAQSLSATVGQGGAAAAAAAAAPGASAPKQSAKEFAADLRKTWTDFENAGGSTGAPAVKAVIRDMWAQTGGRQLQEQAKPSANEFAEMLRKKWNDYIQAGGKTTPDVVAAVRDLWMTSNGTKAVYEAKKKDACYHKVKSRYKVWPSAYASGALVQCRRQGADNWGTGGKKDK